MRLSAPFLASLLAVGACADKQPRPEGPPPTPDAAPAAPETPDPPATPKTPEPPVAPAEPIKCGDTTCTPPEQCLTVIGSIEEAPAREECWIPCESDADCPDGKKCGMIHDGPGQVCDDPA